LNVEVTAVIKPEARAPDNDELEVDLGTLRQWFREAVDKNKKWRDEALEDYEFYWGKQWTDADLLALKSAGRPAITVNRIKPMINLTSGYQRQN
jgi:hypothetical protein